jgi:hypothetical protein
VAIGQCLRPGLGRGHPLGHSRFESGPVGVVAP